MIDLVDGDKEDGEKEVEGEKKTETVEKKKRKPLSEETKKNMKIKRVFN